MNATISVQVDAGSSRLIAESTDRNTIELTVADGGGSAVIELDHLGLESFISMLNSMRMPMERNHYASSCSTPIGVERSMQMLEEIHAAITTNKE